DILGHRGHISRAVPLLEFILGHGGRVLLAEFVHRYRKGAHQNAGDLALLLQKRLDRYEGSEKLLLFITAGGDDTYTLKQLVPPPYHRCHITAGSDVQTPGQGSSDNCLVGSLGPAPLYIPPGRDPFYSLNGRLLPGNLQIF